MTGSLSIASSSSSARRRPLTSSERGRSFRARQRLRAATLELGVEELRAQIAALERSRLLQLERALRLQHVPESADQRTIREFFTLFQDGLAGEPVSPEAAEEIRFKESYLRYVFDQDALVGDLVGLQAAITQWRLYTIFHDRFHLDMRHIDVLGDEESPMFHLHVKLTVRISRKTFQHVFPNALHDEGIVQKFLHRLVEYDCIVWFHFNDDGRIDNYGVNVNFVGGLRRAGGTVDEVAMMLDHAKISSSCTFQDEHVDPARSGEASTDEASRLLRDDNLEALPQRQQDPDCTRSPA